MMKEIENTHLVNIPTSSANDTGNIAANAYKLLLEQYSKFFHFINRLPNLIHSMACQFLNKVSSFLQNFIAYCKQFTNNFTKPEDRLIREGKNIVSSMKNMLNTVVPTQSNSYRFLDSLNDSLQKLTSSLAEALAKPVNDVINAFKI